MIKKQLIQKLNDKSAKIGIIGLGYVGLPLVLRYSEVGYQVTGFDIDQEKVDKITQKESYIAQIPSTAIAEAVEKGFQATQDFTKLSTMDALILCVPTPLSKHREPDLSFITATVESMLPHIRQGQVISLESTTYPGTTEEVVLPMLETQNVTVGQDIYLVYSPEREDPGNKQFDTASIPKICGGCSQDCLDVGVALYAQVINQVVPVSSTKTAEMAKLLENIHRAVNIGLVNEMKIVADKMGIDIHEVINAAATKPFGFVPYYPGPGLGGHCIPIDPFYLTWKAREYGVHTRFIELAGEINSAMPNYVMNKLVEGLNQQGMALKNSKILILGIAYKRNVDDMRESPAVEIMEMLLDKGAQIQYHDPYVPHFPHMRAHYFPLQNTPLNAESIMDFDAVVITTAHDKVDYNMIKEHAKLIIDARGVYQGKHENVIKA